MAHNPIRWIGRRCINTSELRKDPKLLPVRILAHSLGENLPKRDLLVSRQHRMFIASKIAERMFGTSEVLVSAIRLTVLPGVFVDTTVTSVEYVHVLLDSHELLWAEGAKSESLYLGNQTLNAT